MDSSSEPDKLTTLRHRKKTAEDVIPSAQTTMQLIAELTRTI